MPESPLPLPAQNSSAQNMNAPDGAGKSVSRLRAADAILAAKDQFAMVTGLTRNSFDVLEEVGRVIDVTAGSTMFGLTILLARQRTVLLADTMVHEEPSAEQLRDIVALSNADGSRAGAEYVVHGTYKVADEGLPPAKGQKYVLPGGAFFDIRDGRIARVTNYYNLQDWLAQVGG